MRASPSCMGHKERYPGSWEALNDWDWATDPARPGIEENYRVVYDVSDNWWERDLPWKLEVFRANHHIGVNPEGRLTRGPGWQLGGRWRNRISAENKLRESVYCELHTYRRLVSGLSWRDFHFGSVDVARSRSLPHQRPPHSLPKAA